MFGYITARAFIWAASLTSCRALHGTAPRCLHVLHHITPLATRQHVWHQLPCGGCAVMSLTSSWLPPPLGSLHGITNAPAAAFLWGLWALLLYDCCITQSSGRQHVLCHAAYIMLPGNFYSRQAAFTRHAVNRPAAG
jgi:hypothetical protein